MFTSGEDEPVTVSKNTGNIDEAFEIGEGSTTIRIPKQMMKIRNVTDKRKD